MDSKYIITSSGTFINADELYHWGVKGMKWGVINYRKRQADRGITRRQQANIKLEKKSC